MKFHAKEDRSFAKTITWRILATMTTMLLVWLVYPDITKAVTIGLAEFFIKMIVYYSHERAWARISWGLISYD
ncbi:MAG: DUF2061 domain-containing protein [Phycisphaerae bacterium]|nr:DUF2061 domain-containing protein [Phycisphaerae bacterium]